MNDEAVYRTAPATPGLLIKVTKVTRVTKGTKVTQVTRVTRVTRITTGAWPTPKNNF